MLDKKKRDRVAFLVQRRFRELGRKGLLVRVQPEGIDRHKDPVHKAEWFYVPVEIDIPLGKLHRYYELLSRVEEALESQDHINTLIVPFIPEEQAAA